MYGCNEISCARCYYAVDRYNRKGTKIGVECAKDNMRFIDYDIAAVQMCGAFAERNE